MNTLTKGARVGPHGFDSSCIWRAFPVVAVPDGPLRTLHTRVASELGVRDYVSPVDHPMGRDRVRHHSIYIRGRNVSTGTLLARAMRVEMVVARESTKTHNCQKQCDPGSLPGSRHPGCLARTPTLRRSRLLEGATQGTKLRAMPVCAWTKTVRLTAFAKGCSIGCAEKMKTNSYTRRLVETGYTGRGFAAPGSTIFEQVSCAGHSTRCESETRRRRQPTPCGLVRSIGGLRATIKTGGLLDVSVSEKGAGRLALVEMCSRLQGLRAQLPSRSVSGGIPNRALVEADFPSAPTAVVQSGRRPFLQSGVI